MGARGGRDSECEKDGEKNKQCHHDTSVRLAGSEIIKPRQTQGIFSGDLTGRGFTLYMEMIEQAMDMKKKKKKKKEDCLEKGRPLETRR